jgi:hypothetical protein
MKKYLLLIEDEDLWERFKKIIDKDINTEIISLIQEKSKSFFPVPKNLNKKDKSKDFLVEKKIRKGGKDDK